MRPGEEVYLGGDRTVSFAVIANDIDGAGLHSISRIDDDGNVGTYPVVTVQASDLESVVSYLHGVVDAQTTEIAELTTRVTDLERATLGVGLNHPQVLARTLGS